MRQIRGEVADADLVALQQGVDETAAAGVAQHSKDGRDPGGVGDRDFAPAGERGPGLRVAAPGLRRSRSRAASSPSRGATAVRSQF